MTRTSLFSITSFTLIGIIYWLSQNSYVGFGDSIGFLYYASIGFDWETNATSHFLYLNLNHLLLLPGIGNPVRLMTGFSVISGIMALYRLYQLIIVGKVTREAALLSTIAMALSFTWWRQVGSIEVYAFSMWIGMEVLLAMGKDVHGKEDKRSWRVAIWMGIALLIHIQFILLIPAVCVYWFKVKQSRVGKALGPLLVMLLVSSPLLLLPLLLKTHSLSAVFFDHGFQDEVLQFDFRSLVFGGLRSVGYLIYNFHFFLPILFYGCWKSWKQHRYWTLLMLLAAAPFWGFAMRFNVTDTYVFFLLPYFVICVLGSAGWQWLLGKMTAKWLPFLFTFCLGPLLYLSAYHIASEIPQLREFAEPKVYKGGLWYYFWPGQSQSADPIRIATEIRDGKREAIPDFDRYETVLKYLDSAH